MLFKTKVKKDNNEVILSNQRSTNLKLWQKLLAIDSPILKSTWKLIKTFIEFIIVAWIVITIVFFLINIVPGSNALTAGLDANQRVAIETKYGLNLPLIQRYFNYLKGITHNDFGISLSLFPGQEINSFIWERFYKSFLVGIFSVLITVVLGISIGVYVGKNPGGLADNISTIIISIFSSVPSLIFALVLVFIGRSINLPYIFDAKDFLTYILPGLALSLSSILVYIKYIRTELNREINSVHAKFAYLKGLSKNRFVWKHALKPSLFPIATFFPAVVLGSFIGGFFIEQIFFIPGSGATFLQAIQSKDYNVILFLITLYTLLTILSYTLRDILYEAIDPRVRRKAK